MDIKVCVGSSCHLKGSYDVIEEFKRLIKKFDKDDVIDLSASFCLGKCKDGVSVKVDDEIFTGLSKDNVEEFFVENVLPRA